MMGGDLEYTMCSLPDLSFQNSGEMQHRVTGLLKKYAGPGGEELSPAEILDGEAQKFLPASAFYIFQKMNLKNIHEAEFQKSKSKVLSAFSTFDFQLKKEIKAWRTSKKEGDKKAGKNKLENIAGEGTPLEKEIRILQYQWRKLEELSAGHFADFEALVTYKLKLLILLRWWSFDAEKGFEKFTTMTVKN